MRKRNDGVVEPSDDNLMIYHLLKEVKRLSKRVDELEKKVNNG